MLEDREARRRQPRYVSALAAPSIVRLDLVEPHRLRYAWNLVQGSRVIPKLGGNRSAKLMSREGSLQINGKDIRSDLPVQLNIKLGPPIVFNEPAIFQTRPATVGKSQLVRQSVGAFHFHAASEESGIKEPDSLFGEVVVSDSLFASLWLCVRTPSCKFHFIFFDVFGAAMHFSRVATSTGSSQTSYLRIFCKSHLLAAGLARANTRRDRLLDKAFVESVSTGSWRHDVHSVELRQGLNGRLSLRGEFA